MSHQDALKTYASLIKALIAVAAAIFYLSTGTKAPKVSEVLKIHS